MRNDDDIVIQPVIELTQRDYAFMAGWACVALACMLGLLNVARIATDAILERTKDIVHPVHYVELDLTKKESRDER